MTARPLSFNHCIAYVAMTGACLLAAACTSRTSPSSTTSRSSEDAAVHSDPTGGSVSAGRPTGDFDEADIDPTADAEESAAWSHATARRLIMAGTGVARQPDRGIGGVMTVGLIPWKVVAAGGSVALLDQAGVPKRLMRPGIPYFVFENRGDDLLVAPLQDRDTASANGGWVAPERCYSWFSRRLVYPAADGALANSITAAVGESHALPPLDPREALPWPMLGVDLENDTWLVLCDLRPYDGGFVPLAVPMRFQHEFDLFVILTSTELKSLLADMTRLAAAIGPGRMENRDIPALLGAFLSQNRIDFIDLHEVQQIVDAFPGGAPDYLQQRLLDDRCRMLERFLSRKIDLLSRIAGTSQYYNEQHGVYVLPFAWLESPVSDGE